MPKNAPPRWSADDFERNRQAAISLFRQERMEEDLGVYAERFVIARQAVTELFEACADLAAVGEPAVAVEITTKPVLLEAFRYVAGPPISADDVATLADTTLAPTLIRKDPAKAQAIVETVMLGHDRDRFPWVAAARAPTDEERRAAIVATAALIAQRRVLTRRQNESKEEQELAVAEALAEHAGLRQVRPRVIDTFTDAPDPGEFCRESHVGGRKADIVVRLWDGRLMPTECKVSNSSVNSVKRLNNDAAKKAKTWLEKFGSSQTVPAAVLGGVFKRHNLEDAQDDGLTIWWSHRLDEMIDWIDATR